MSEITERLSTAIADRYKILSHLGQGGMATVYLAEDIKHDRKVALKVLRPELAAVIGAERFLNEIKVTANLQHPHILPLHDSGEADSFLYYVMPFVEGDTLRDKIDREKQLGIDDAIDISRSVASALDYAHRQGVIHRDIKPENILLHDGQALVADFGIALAISAAGGNRLTETGLSIGTPHYMSPEQAMGDRELDARSDVYSLGAMMYEMLTGDPPYQGSTAQAIVAKVITEKAPPVTATRDTVPGHVAAAVQKALAKLPADRFTSAAEFADALTRPGAIPLTVTADAADGSHEQRRVVGLGVVAGIAIVAGALGAFLGRGTAPGPEPRLTRFVVPAPDSVVSFGRCCGAAMALSPDGARMVFVGFMSGNRGPLYRRELGRLEAEPIPGTDEAEGPFFSPDGRWVGFYQNGRLRKVSMAGGPPVSIAEVSDFRGGSWGDNDVIVFVNDEDNRLYTVSANGGTPQGVRMDSGDANHRHPSMLPGGRAALFSIDPPGGLENHRIAVVDLEAGVVDTLLEGTRAMYASGYIVYTGSDGTLLAHPFDPKARRLTGQAVAILDGVIVRGDGNGEFSVSPGGGLAYYPGAGGGAEDLQLIGPDGARTIPLPERANLEDLEFSPDGRRIAMRLTDVGEGTDVWVFDRDDNTLIRLTVEGNNQSPVWTLDGQRIAFASDRGGQNEIYWKRSDGSGVAEKLFGVPGGSAHPSEWMDDSTLLMVRRIGAETQTDIGLLTVGDSAPRMLVETPFWERQPQVSLDRRWLAYTSDRSGDAEVYVQPLRGDGRRVQVSITGGWAPRWSADGRTLFYGTTGEIMAASVVTDPDARIVSRTSRFTGAIDFNFIQTNWDLHPETDELLVILQGDLNTFANLVWIQDWQEIIRGMQTGR